MLGATGRAGPRVVLLVLLGVGSFEATSVWDLRLIR